MGFFITCRGCWLNGDWWRFYYRQNCSLKRLDDDGLSLKGGSSMRDGHRGNERFRLNGNLGAKLNGPLRCLEKLCCVNKCVILLQIEEEWFKEGNECTSPTFWLAGPLGRLRLSKAACVRADRQRRGLRMPGDWRQCLVLQKKNIENKKKKLANIAA